MYSTACTLAIALATSASQLQTLKAPLERFSHPTDQPASVGTNAPTTDSSFSPIHSDSVTVPGVMIRVT